MADLTRSRSRPASLLVRLLMMLALSFAAMLQPAAAQSVLRDAETEDLFRDMVRPLVEAAGMRPENVNVVLLNSSEINAFVAGGQTIYFFSGTITSADNANEIQGIMAHELGHITGGHVLSTGEGAKAATGIMILSLLLGAAAMAAGGGEAGAGIMAAGQQAALGKFLAFNRVQESAADQAGAAYLNKAGITGKGSLSFFRKLQNQEFRYAIPQTDDYPRTHPLSGDRIQALEEVYRSVPSWEAKPDPLLEERFQRVKAKLAGFVDDPKRTLVRYPETDKTIPARYARAYAWHKSAYPDRASAEVDALLAARPRDPYFLELKGQILLESGKPREALESLREAMQLAPDQPLISALFGHALISTEDDKNFDEAKRVLRAAIGRDNSNPFAWYQLGIIFDREGDTAGAALATAERHSLEGNVMGAMTSAHLAMKGTRPGTRECLRAQDIAMASRALIEQNRDKSAAKRLAEAEKRRPAPVECGGGRTG